MVYCRGIKFFGCCLCLAAALGAGGRAGADEQYVLEFSGDGDYVQLEHNDSIDLTEELTFAAWVYLRSWTGDWHQFAGKGDDSWMLRRQPTAVYTDRCSNGVDLVLRGPEVDIQERLRPFWRLPFSEWVHLAFTLDAAGGEAKLYVNGEAILEDNGIEGTLNSNAFPLVAGAHKEDPGSAQRFHDGYMSDVRLYNRALSKDEIGGVLRRTSEAVDGLVLHWPLDEGRGQTAHDVSGSGNHGEIIGGAWQAVEEPFWVDRSPVPDLAGLSRQEAEARIGEKGFTVGDVTEVDRGARVVGQRPSPGERVPADASIHLTIAAESARDIKPAPPERAVPIILDMDMESDVDDVGALVSLHALADRGEAEILGVVVSAKNPYATLCADRINTYFGRPDLPLGQLKGDGVDRDSRYAQQVAEEFPGRLESADDAPDAVALYREILAAQPDESVVLVTIGYKTNVRDLLASGPCEHSDLDGRELAEQKFRIWICMGGRFPEGREANLLWDAQASAEAIEAWPTEIIFSGWGIGASINTANLMYRLPEDNPARRAYQLFNNLQPHSSWDQAALLYAVRALDDGPAADYWVLSEPGQIQVDPESGHNTWQDSPGGPNRYKIENRDPDLIADEIDVLMMHTPSE